ncbi:Prophage LambdaBa01, membrane protein [Bacillus cereus Rock1-15]|uniref:phage tail protein n=1 Tax=Bacillus cereus TaxID=1396 RepID=UPI0001A07C9F|nr:Prophage LambdaBa01, membrane protein [Bacillus cereus Rock1-15]
MMAGGRIKGISISIDGETTGLQNALKDVNKRSNDLTKELKDVERLLKFDPGNIEALAQKQQLLTQQIENTTQKLDKLKAAEQQVQAQFQNGKISEEQYRTFRREIEFTEGSLNGLKNKLGNMKAEQDSVASSTRQLETLFSATGKSVDDFAGALGNRLVNAIKSGTATSRQLEQAIGIIGREALGAETDIEKLQRALRSVDAGNSIQQVRNELRDLQQEAGRTEKKFEGLKVGLENVIGGMAAGGGIASAVEKAMDMSKLQTKIDITFDVPESSKQSVEAAVRGVTAYGVDAEASLEGVRRQWALNKNVSDEANAAVVKGAAAIAQSYEGIDFTELIQETNEIGNELGISQDGALGLTNALLKMGFPPEQLDIIAEYGGQLTRAGYSAEEVQAIMEAGVETGTWNIDNLLDGLKEGRIKAAEFGQGVDKAMKEALEGTNISAEQVEKWGQAVANGGKEGSAAMTEIAQALSQVDDETKRNELGVKFFGTMYEDQGQNIINTLLGAKEKTVDFQKNQEQLNGSIKKMDANPAVKFQKAMQDLQMALKPVLGVIADVVAKIADWISNNPKLAATLAAIAVAIGVIAGAFMALAPIVVVISGVGAAMMGWVALIAVVVAAVVALGVLIYQNWDSIKQWTIDAWNAIGEFLVGIWDGIVQWASEAWNSISESTSAIWNSIKEFLIGIWNGIVEFVVTWGTAILETYVGIWTSIFNFCMEIWNGIVEYLTSVLQGIATFFTEIWTSISTFFQETWNGLVAFVTPVLQGIADFFSMIWNGISTVIQAVWNFISQYLQAIWTAILYFATPLFESIKNFISECWNKIKSTTSLVWETIKNFLVSCWNGLVSFVTPIFEKIKSWIVSVWDTISSATMAVWNAVKNFLQACWNGLVAIVTPIFDAIKNWIVNVWNTISSTTSAVWNAIKSYLSSLWNSIVSTASSIFNSIKSAISTVWNMISSASSSVWNGIKSTLSSIWNGIKSTASSVWNGLKDAIMTPVRWVTSAVSGAFNGMKSAVLGVWDGIKSGIRTAINGIIRIINKFIDGFNTPAELLNEIPGVSAPTIPHVPMLAKGGKPVGDGSFITGEAGPELFTKKGNSITVTPLSSKEKSLGITGTMNQLMGDMSRMMASSMSQLAGLKSVMSGVYGSMSNSRQAMAGNIANQVFNYSSGQTGGNEVISAQGRDLVIEVPVILDGRDLARGTYRYTKEYQEREEQRNSAF